MRKLAETVAIGLVVLFSAATQAAMVIFDPGTTNATAILGLDVDADNLPDFDVSFWNLTDADPDLTELSSPTPCGGGITEPPCGIFEFVNLGNPGMVGDEAGAQAAANAIKDALNLYGATSAGTAPDILNLTITVLYQMDVSGCGPPQQNGNCSWQAANSGSTWNLVSGESTLTAGFEYAVFAPAAAVPVPPAVWLFGSGLAMLGWLRRRRAGCTNTSGTNA